MNVSEETFQNSVKKIAYLFIGESFRSGTQGSRIIGQPQSYDSQKKATESHIKLMNHIKNKYNYDADIYISSVTTCYTTDLLSWYSPVIASTFIKQEYSSIHYHIKNSIKLIKNKEEYSHIFIFRIDLVFKDYMIEILNPNTIIKFTFPTICFIPLHKVKGTGLPRINGMFFLIPNKYFNLLSYYNINYEHNTWSDFVRQQKATNADFDVLIDTYHDSDPYKDWNPLYYLCCRDENTTWHTKGYIFNKKTLEPECKEITYLSM